MAYGINKEIPAAGRTKRKTKEIHRVTTFLLQNPIPPGRLDIEINQIKETILSAIHQVIIETGHECPYRPQYNKRKTLSNSDHLLHLGSLISLSFLSSLSSVILSVISYVGPAEATHQVIFWT